MFRGNRFRRSLLHGQPWNRTPGFYDCPSTTVWRRLSAPRGRAQHKSGGCGQDCDRCPKYSTEPHRSTSEKVVKDICDRRLKDQTTLVQPARHRRVNTLVEMMYLSVPTVGWEPSGHRYMDSESPHRRGQIPDRRYRPK
jgi:hypothetical protein